MGNTRKILMGASALAGAFALLATPAGAETKTITFDLPAQPLGESLRDFYRESGEQIVFSEGLVAGRTGAALKGDYTPDQALAMLLDGSGLTTRRTSTGVVMIEAPQSGSAAGDGADGTVAALIVTAQKREEQIQDVPIAISAFTEKTLEEQKIEGGFDLLKAIPNVTFSKNNFTSYNFSIRGIGTKAVSATTDPGVAVSFNNIALIQNRLFEQEYFDVERVEVLRGPQGTLYGRNATAGVINVISAKPNLNEFDGWVKGEVGNYHSKRISAMINIPLVEDKLGVRIAGSLTDRQGYDYNATTNHPVNGRDLWSGRVTVAFNPTERIRSNLVWERFNENDNRSRTGKQLCYHDSGPSQVGGIPTAPDPTYAWQAMLIPALFSQGCKPGSLYDDKAFGTPNGLAEPFIFAILVDGTECSPPSMPSACSPIFQLGYDRPHYVNGVPDPQARAETIIDLKDPYGGMMQARDLRVINSIRDPIYRAKANVIELNFDVDLSAGLTFSSQTAYDKDQTYSFQDFNRFNTVDIIHDTSQIYASERPAYFTDPAPRSTFWANLAPGGVFCDPQLGCAKSIAGFDIAQAKGTQFSQEFRLQSDFKGKLNFSVGANYTRYRTLVDYYVMYNLITAFAMMRPFGLTSDYTKCTVGLTPPSEGFKPIQVDFSDPRCNNNPYIDPNPVSSINGEGHNYFRSENPYKLESAAAFGEVYWQATDTTKVTAGLRYTDDRKDFTLIPTRLLSGEILDGHGAPNRGLPVQGHIKQQWGAWTGRIGVDWKPKTAWTDQTMVYAFYSRGYKGGGANPPGIYYDPNALVAPVKDYSDTFAPEFVNAFELGSKNTLMDGGLTVNGDVFFYDYKNYQISTIKDRTAVNDNFDARLWGAELETVFAPRRDIRIIANFGYLNTNIDGGQKSVDVMDRTAGNPNYVVVKPWVTLPSNCVVPVWVAQSFLEKAGGQIGLGGYQALCSPGHGGVGGDDGGGGFTPDPHFGGAFYDPANYPELHGGVGIAKPIGGNELPNSPHWTMNIGAQKSWDFLEGWRATFRTDGYWQSQSWARVYNAVNDKLHGWYNLNLSLWIERPEDSLKIELYAKNVLDKTPITDAFINSDDTALTTNVFVLDPRLIGLSIHKGF